VAVVLLNSKYRQSRNQCQKEKRELANKIYSIETIPGRKNDRVRRDVNGEIQEARNENQS
jgi:hypothetical protein